MNETATGRQTTVEGNLLDRLVDGELGEADRRALLGRLDAEPDGWKRCAMAFLEAQAWQAAMRPTRAAAPPVGHAPHAVGTARNLVFRHVLGVAAAVVLAFGVGFVARGTVPSPGRPIAQRPPGASAAPQRRAHPLHRVEFSTGGGNVRLPVLAGAAATPEELLRERPAVPAYLSEQFRRQGYEVKGDRKLVQVALEDGRTVAVPVDTVSYRYVGQRVH